MASRLETLQKTMEKDKTKLIFLLKMHSEFLNQWPMIPQKNQLQEVQLDSSSYEEYLEKNGLVHTFGENDTLRSIAKQYDIPIDKIKKSKWFIARGYKLDDNLPIGRKISLKNMK